MPTKEQKLAADLRSLADWLEQREFAKSARFGFGDLYIFHDNATDFGESVRTMGQCKKLRTGDNDHGYLQALRSFGEIEVRACIEQVKACERVKTGERVIPASPEHTVPATEERVEEIYEWKCPDSFLALAEQSEA